MVKITSRTPGSTLKGTSDNDIMMSIGDNQTISSGAGKDEITAFGDRVDISSGDGDDLVTSFGKDGQIFTGAGNDTVFTYGNNDIITAGPGNDMIAAYGRGTRINLGEGNNKVIAGADQMTITGTSGKDNIALIGNNSTIEAGSGGSTVTVAGTNNKVLYNANLNEGNWAKFTANPSGSNTVVISLDKPLSASVLSQITKDFANAQNKLFDFSGYKGILAPIPADPTGAMMLKVQGFKNLAFNINPSATDDAANVLLNAKYAQLATTYKQNVLANDISNNGNELKLSMISKITSDAAVGKVIITKAESWNAQAGEIDAYFIKTASDTATLTLKSDGTVILNSNGAFDNLQKDLGQADFHLEIIYQSSDQLGGHAMATDKITITNTLPAVSSILDLTGASAHTMVLGPNVNDSIDLSTLNSGLTGNVLYTVIGNLGSIDATGHLNVSSQALFKANANLSGATNIDILATDANGNSKVIEVKYGYNLTPAISQEYTHALDNNNVNIPFLPFKDLQGPLTYKVISDSIRGGIAFDGTTLKATSDYLFNNKDSLGNQIIKVVATDQQGNSELQTIKFHIDSAVTNITSNLNPTDITSHVTFLSQGDKFSIQLPDTNILKGLSGNLAYHVDSPYSIVIDSTGHATLEGFMGDIIDRTSPGLTDKSFNISVTVNDSHYATQMFQENIKYSLDPSHVVFTRSSVSFDPSSKDLSLLSVDFTKLFNLNPSGPNFSLAMGNGIEKLVSDPITGHLMLQAKAEDIYNLNHSMSGNFVTDFAIRGGVYYELQTHYEDYSLLEPAHNLNIKSSSVINLNLSDIFKGDYSSGDKFSVVSSSNKFIDQSLTADDHLQINQIPLYRALNGAFGDIKPDTTNPESYDDHIRILNTTKGILAEVDFQVPVPTDTSSGNESNVITISGSEVLGPSLNISIISPTSASYTIVSGPLTVTGFLADLPSSVNQANGNDYNIDILTFESSYSAYSSIHVENRAAPTPQDTYAFNHVALI